MSLTLQSAVSTYGASAKAKLANLAASGEPEEQLRAPLEHLFLDLAELCGFPRDKVTPVGETSLAELKTRPDFALTVHDTLVGFVEVKAPGKGAEPKRYKDKHDKAQWEKLQSLPNLLYTDGNEFSLWRSGERQGEVIRLEGDVEQAGPALKAPTSLLALFEDFFRWEPIPPRDAKALAEMSARLCRLLRDEVTEQLERKSEALTNLAKDWRMVFDPETSDFQFADGYAQTVTFGLLMARAREIRLGEGFDQVAKELGKTNTLIGSSLRFLTDNVESQETLKTSLGTLARVLDAVHWPTISKGDPEAWLYFYEDFLGVYDNNLRKLTGSYYTPPEVVGSMIRLVDEVLQSRFSLPSGLASPTVTVADPAVGTGTFPLGLLRRIAEKVAADEGEGAVPAAIEAAVQRLIAFELQLGPFAVAQMRILAELADLIGSKTTASPRMFVTDTLGSPNDTEGRLPGFYEKIAESRRKANKIKREEPITVVIGNPPYKEKAKGRGGWVESGGPEPAPLQDWMPPREWGVGTHAKHLRNLYIYFWRWATWKVFDNDPKHNSGVVCFITVAGFLNGPGFEKMRDDLRRKAADIWVIDCSPEGHQPDVPTRIFQGVQQTVCIVLVSRPPGTDPDTPARVHYHVLPKGPREGKFEALADLTLDDEAAWIHCPTDWRAPFLPAAVGAWAEYPSLEDFFLYNGSGVMPGRTWIIAPDKESLLQRWQTLIEAPETEKEALFHPHLRKGKPGDKHSKKVVPKGLPGFPSRRQAVADDKDSCIPPLRYGFRTLDRQWIIPDSRLINQANPTLWEAYSDRQVYLTAFEQHSPTSGPAVTFTGLMPDLHHYKGSFGGRAFPLWQGRDTTSPNLPSAMLDFLAQTYERDVRAEDVTAYLAAVASHPAFTVRFKDDLVQPGIRIPLTADPETFAEAVELGKTVIWLQTFGERFADPRHGRPASPPRMPKEGPRIPAKGTIPSDPASMPDSIEYDESTHRLMIGTGFIEHVSPEVWRYEVSGKQVLRQWFSYRKKNRERPIIGDRRQPSKLGDIQPDHWLAEYTTELLNVLHVIGRLVELEPAQAALLDKICSGPLISAAELLEAGAIGHATGSKAGASRDEDSEQPKLFD